MKRGRQPRVAIETLIAEYNAGATLQEIAERHGYTSRQAVQQRLKKAGVQIRPRHSFPRVYEDRICPTCLKPFRPDRPEQVHCSRACFTGSHHPTCRKGHPLTPDNLTPRYKGTPPRC